MQIVKLENDQVQIFEELIRVFSEVFEKRAHSTSTTHLSRLLSNPNFFVFVIILNNQVVGGATVYILEQYDQQKPLAYIYDVGILPAFQQKGLGKALMLTICNDCRQHGCKAAYVEAEAEDPNAVLFYRKTKPTSEIVANHFNYNLSEDTA